MEKQFAIIDKAVFVNEENYSNFLETFEKDFGEIDGVTQHNARYHKDKMILEIKMKFNVEEQYQLYLKRMALSEKTMHPQQKIQLRQTFFGAAGQLLLWLREDLSALEESEAINTFEDLIKQVGDFFLSETHRNN